MTRHEFKKTRHLLGITQQQLGDLFGYTNAQVQVCRIETGTAKVAAITERFILVLLEVKTRYPGLFKSWVKAGAERTKKVA